MIEAIQRVPSLFRLVVGLLLAVGCAGEASRLTEDRLQASMLLQLTRFVVWPQARPAAPSMKFCVYGSERFFDTLRSVTQNEAVQNRPVAVARVSRSSEIGPCDLIWVAAISEREFAAITDAAARTGTLTASDSETFTQRGGMVGIVPRDGKMSLEINREAGEQAGLQFSSKLLKLARLVRTAGVR